MFAALVALIHKTEPPGDQVLEVLATCCLPQLLGHPQQMKNKIRIKSSQGWGWHHVNCSSVLLLCITLGEIRSVKNFSVSRVARH